MIARFHGGTDVFLPAQFIVQNDAKKLGEQDNLEEAGTWFKSRVGDIIFKDEGEEGFHHCAFWDAIGEGLDDDVPLGVYSLMVLLHSPRLMVLLIVIADQVESFSEVNEGENYKGLVFLQVAVDKVQKVNKTVDGIGGLLNYDTAEDLWSF